MDKERAFREIISGDYIFGGERAAAILNYLDGFESGDRAEAFGKILACLWLEGPAEEDMPIWPDNIIKHEERNLKIESVEDVERVFGSPGKDKEIFAELDKTLKEIDETRPAVEAAAGKILGVVYELDEEKRLAAMHRVIMDTLIIPYRVWEPERVDNEEAIKRVKRLFPDFQSFIFQILTTDFNQMNWYERMAELMKKAKVLTDDEQTAFMLCAFLRIRHLIQQSLMQPIIFAGNPPSGEAFQGQKSDRDTSMPSRRDS